MTKNKRQKERAALLLEALQIAYPAAHCALRHRNPLQLLVATILSAQCTDKRVNLVTPRLFRRFVDAAALASASQQELEKIIRSTGFFRNKAKNIRLAARMVVERFDGTVPSMMPELLQLPGVARKTANVVLSNAFEKNEGVVVDTHVARTSLRLGLTKEVNPVKIEADLMALFPRSHWGMLSHYLIELGRDTCRALKPRCGQCRLRELCPLGRKSVQADFYR